MTILMLSLEFWVHFICILTTWFLKKEKNICCTFTYSNRNLLKERSLLSFTEIPLIQFCDDWPQEKLFPPMYLSLGFCLLILILSGLPVVVFVFEWATALVSSSVLRLTLPVGAQPPFAQLYFLQPCFQQKKIQYFLVFLLLLTVPSQKLNWTLIIEWSGPPPKWYLWMISLVSALLTWSLGLQCFQAS